MSLPAIEVSGLSKRYVIEHESRHDTLRDTLHHTARKLWRRFRWGTGFQREEFWALKDVSFTVQPGEVVGIIGRNGAGKSTLLKILSRITEPTTGKVTLRGRVASLLEVGTGFHPDLTGRENIYLNGAILGMRRAEIRRKFDEIVAFAEVEKFLDPPVKRYSSGMYVRLAFAVAAHLEPEILIVDEVLSVGDAQFQKKCLGKMQDVATREGRTVLFVSHNMAAVQNLCARALLLSTGRCAAEGLTNEVIARHLNDARQTSQLPLLTRTDRSGNGAIRFSQISILGPEGTIVASARVGDPTTIRLVIACASDILLRSLHVSLAIRDHSDAVVCYVSSAVNGGDFENVPASMTQIVDVHFPRLQIMPGPYSLTLYAKVGEELADWIKDAAAFEVTPGDYYGSGRLPQPTQGQFLPDYTLSLKEVNS